MPDFLVSLSAEDYAYVAERMEQGGFADPSSFFRELLHADREALGRLLAAIDEGEASGVSELAFDQIIERAREQARSRAA